MNGPNDSKVTDRPTPANFIKFEIKNCCPKERKISTEFIKYEKFLIHIQHYIFNKYLTNNNESSLLIL